MLRHLCHPSPARAPAVLLCALTLACDPSSQPPDDGGSTPDDGGPKLADGGPKLADGGPELADGGPELADGGPRDAAQPPPDGGSDTEPPDESSLIFHSDFDSQPDWAVQHSGQRYTSLGSTAHDGSSGFVAQDNVPAGFSYFYTSERWHPNGDKNGNDGVPGSQPVAQINNREGSHLSPTGKSLIITDESYGAPGAWGADAVLMRDMGEEHSQLWVEIWVKFQPDYQFESVLDGSGQSAWKFFRVRRWAGSPTESRFNFFGANSRKGSPVAIFDFKEWATSATRSLTRSYYALRGYSTSDEYGTPEDYYSFMDSYPTKVESSILQGGDAALDFYSHLGDGEWHKVNLFLAMDSAPGAGDGVVEFWLDDIREMRIDDIPWRQAGDPADMGWDELSIGGNANNVWADESAQAEQWYAVSSIKVWTERPD